MAIKNLMLDIVTNAVNEVIKNDEAILESIENKYDIIAYVLNRVPPKYITSERGILHGTLDSMFKIQEKIDVLWLIYEAITEINNRRSTKKSNSDEPAFIVNNGLPHIIGTVLEESTLSIIPNVKVSLLHNNKIAKMVYAEWDNPYQSHKSTMGYYHFWPHFLDKEMDSKSKQSFQLKFHHKKFNNTAIDIEVKTLSKSELGEAHVVPIVLMKAKEGENLDFLYEE